MILGIFVLTLITIVKSEVWIISLCLGLGHEAMVLAVYFAMSYQKCNWAPFITSLQCGIDIIFDICHQCVHHMTRVTYIQATKSIFWSHHKAFIWHLMPCAFLAQGNPPGGELLSTSVHRKRNCGHTTYHFGIYIYIHTYINIYQIIGQACVTSNISLAMRLVRYVY